MEETKESFEVYEKPNGSLIILFKHNNQIYCERVETLFFGGIYFEHAVSDSVYRGETLAAYWYHQFKGDQKFYLKQGNN